jgi:hypothetical protein
VEGGSGEAVIHGLAESSNDASPIRPAGVRRNKNRLEISAANSDPSDARAILRHTPDCGMFWCFRRAPVASRERGPLEQMAA